MQLEVGSVLEGKVTGITKFGAFVDLGSGKTGMVHISEVASQYVNDINEHLTVGQTVKVKVMTVADDGKISLSIKRAEPRPERPQGQQNNSNYNRDNRERRDRPQTFSSAPQTGGSFDDMVSRFLQSSDEKMTALRKNGGSERRSRRGAYSKQNQYYD
ncbi:MAG: S1 RNA-binding domain-containing protein [Ruminococcaceae bacterium]|nr:S1 RNA-binding domain-containing protein [Oscillospiraceae bacterium]